MTNIPKSPLDLISLKYIQEAKMYRHQFPRKSDNSRTDLEVSAVLSLADTLTNK